MPGAQLISCEIVKEVKERIPRLLLCACVKETIQRYGRNGTCSLSIVFVSQEKIRKLNKIYRDKDAPTDVLSFESEIPNKEKKEGVVYLGEIIICSAYIRKHAQRDMRWELCHVVVHGTLHLLGKHHEHSEKARQKMHNLEEKIINKVLRAS